MAFEFFWQVPTGPDGRYGDAQLTRQDDPSGVRRSPLGAGVTDPRAGRFNAFDYYHQVARAAELAGFDGIQVRSDPEGDESWIVAGYIARSTRRLKVLAEFDASWGSAVYAAKNAVSFQRFTGGRFAWHIHPGGDAALRGRRGDGVADADVAARIEEFVTVARGVLTTSPYDFKGRFFEVQGGGFKGPLAGQPVPVVYLSGESGEVLAVSAKQADVHIFSAAPLKALEPALKELAVLAGRQGRSVRPGLRIDLLARETEQEAVFDARRFATQSGQPNVPFQGEHSTLWPRLTAARTGAAATLVGSYEQIIDRLVALSEAGFQSFQLASVPHFEEALRVGEYILPELRSRLALVPSADPHPSYALAGAAS